MIYYCCFAQASTAGLYFPGYVWIAYGRDHASLTITTTTPSCEIGFLEGVLTLEPVVRKTGGNIRDTLALVSLYLFVVSVRARLPTNITDHKVTIITLSQLGLWVQYQHVFSGNV